MEGPLFIVAIILNLVFYILFAFFLVVAVNKNQKTFISDVFSRFNQSARKKAIIAILSICAIQIFVDAVKLFLNSYIGVNSIYAFDLLSILSWVSFYLICTDANENIFRKRKALVVVAIFLAIAIIVTYCNYKIAATYSLTVSKYVSGSTLANNILGNLEFWCQIKAVLIDTLSGVVLLAWHFIFNKMAVAPRNGSKKKTAKVSSILRGAIAIICAFVLVGAKTVILPASCFKGYDVRSSKNWSIISSESFSATTVTTQIKRLDKDQSEKIVYQVTKNQLFYDGILVLEYNSTDALSATAHEQTGNQMTLKDRFEKVEGSVEFYLYKNEVICYLDHGTPVAIYSNDIQEQNDRLTAIYKDLIKRGNWNFYEQAAGYLQKYDPSFIASYLKRYSAGNFLSVERKTLDEMSINSQYIQSISSDLLDSR
jgi:REP element-mobilizing transposase RayT/uncharacterized protein (UPF0297 family)